MTWQFSGSVSRAGDSYASTDGYPRSLDDEPDYDDPDAYDYDDYDDYDDYEIQGVGSGWHGSPPR